MQRVTASSRQEALPMTRVHIMAGAAAALQHMHLYLHQGAPTASRQPDLANSYQRTKVTDKPIASSTHAEGLQCSRPNMHKVCSIKDRSVGLCAEPAKRAGHTYASTHTSGFHAAHRPTKKTAPGAKQDLADTVAHTVQQQLQCASRPMPTLRAGSKSGLADAGQKQNHMTCMSDLSACDVRWLYAAQWECDSVRVLLPQLKQVTLRSWLCDSGPQDQKQAARHKRATPGRHLHLGHASCISSQIMSIAPTPMRRLASDAVQQSLTLPASGRHPTQRRADAHTDSSLSQTQKPLVQTTSTLPDRLPRWRCLETRQPG